MNSLVSLLVLTCACARAEPLAAALQRRSDAQAYAHQYMRYRPRHSALAGPAARAEYSTIADSNAYGSTAYNTAAGRNEYSTLAGGNAYSRNAYGSAAGGNVYSRNPYGTAGNSFAGANAYAALSLHAPFPVLHVLSNVPLHQADHAGAYSALMPTYARPFPYAAPSNDQFTYDINSETDEPTILYARPNPRGGYTYRRRRRPVRRRTPAPARPAEPIVIRVHKHRVVRDR